MVKRVSKREKNRSVASHKKRVLAEAVAVKIKENPTMAIGTALREVGASEYAARNPAAALTNTPEWNELLDSYLPRGELLETHRGLLRASRIDHLIFTRDGEPSDEEIGMMLLEVNCKVRKIVHGEQARHVYFYAPDNRARKDALEMAYKLRGDFAGDKAAVAFSLVALAQTQAIGTLPPASNAPQLPSAI